MDAGGSGGQRHQYPAAQGGGALVQVHGGGARRQGLGGGSLLQVQGGGARAQDRGAGARVRAQGLRLRGQTALVGGRGPGRDDDRVGAHVPHGGAHAVGRHWLRAAGGRGGGRAQEQHGGRPRAGPGGWCPCTRSGRRGSRTCAACRRAAPTRTTTRRATPRGARPGRCPGSRAQSTSRRWPTRTAASTRTRRGPSRGRAAARATRTTGVRGQGRRGGGHGLDRDGGAHVQQLGGCGRERESRAAPTDGREFQSTVPGTHRVGYADCQYESKAPTVFKSGSQYEVTEDEPKAPTVYQGSSQYGGTATTATKEQQVHVLRSSRVDKDNYVGLYASHPRDDEKTFGS